MPYLMLGALTQGEDLFNRKVKDARAVLSSMKYSFTASESEIATAYNMIRALVTDANTLLEEPKKSAVRDYIQSRVVDQWVSDRKAGKTMRTTAGRSYRRLETVLTWTEMPAPPPGVPAPPPPPEIREVIVEKLVEKKVVPPWVYPAVGVATLLGILAVAKKR